MSGNLFQDILKDPKGVEERLLGPSYSYSNNIKDPKSLGMSDQGSLKQMGKNVDGLLEYVNLLVSGKSDASKTGKPLGNKFFLQTGAKCKATDQCTDGECLEETRHIYVDNVPDGTIPFISDAAGVKFDEFRGLIPGAMGNLTVLNPFNIMRAFMAGSMPDCQPVTLEVINTKNVKTNETHYVTVTDIRNISPCAFDDKINPVTNAKCKEKFGGMDGGDEDSAFDSVDYAYMAASIGVGLFLFYHIFMQNNRKRRTS